MLGVACWVFPVFLFSVAAAAAAAEAATAAAAAAATAVAAADVSSRCGFLISLEGWPVSIFLFSHLHSIFCFFIFVKIFSSIS